MGPLSKVHRDACLAAVALYCVSIHPNSYKNASLLLLPGGQLTTTGRENVKTVSPLRLVTLMSSPWEQIMVFTI